jgi:hypothetical protein
MSPRPILPSSTDRDDNVYKRDMLRKEVTRVRRDLESAHWSNDVRRADSARNALERIEGDLARVMAWLVAYDADLLEKATTLLQSLADEGTDFNSSEYELIKKLVDRQQNQ